MAEVAEQLAELQQRKEAIHLQRDIAQAQVDIRLLESEAEQGRVVLLEDDWGQYINPTAYLFDDPTFAPTGAFVRPAVPISRRDDRADGRYQPVFENEQELCFIRGACRIVAVACGTGVNILDLLDNYTIAGGIDIAVECEQKELRDRVQKVIDVFCQDNGWKSDLEVELHHRSREDGEALLRLQPQEWRTKATIAEPDELTQPYNTHQLEDWIADRAGDIGCATSWSFGVRTPASDCSDPLGYHIVRDMAGTDWEYCPTDVAIAMQLNQPCMEMIKRNVPRNVKRGFSDMFAVLQDLDRLAKLKQNTEEGAAIQAAIAGIRKHASTATTQQVQDLRNANKTGNARVFQDRGGFKKIPREQFRPGRVVDTTSDWMYGPMGQPSGPLFIQVIQMAARYCGARWAIPEYMISMDASNNNFASILVAGSPFVRAREADQRFYEGRYSRVFWKVVQVAFEAGFFQGLVSSWDELRQRVEINLTAKDITIADDLKDAQVRNIEMDNGTLSQTTWMKERGRDPEEERTNMAKEGGKPVPTDAPQPSPEAPPNSPVADAGVQTDLTLNGAQIDSARNILLDLHLGNVAADAAIELLNAVGISRDRCVAMVNAQQKLPVKPVDATATAAKPPKPVSESLAPLLEHIEKLPDGKYRLYSKTKGTDGKRKNLGTFASRDEAERHEKAVDYFKHINESQASNADGAPLLETEHRFELARALLFKDYP